MVPPESAIEVALVDLDGADDEGAACRTCHLEGAGDVVRLLLAERVAPDACVEGGAELAQASARSQGPKG
jgi:hypothetical protein